MKELSDGRALALGGVMFGLAIIGAVAIGAQPAEHTTAAAQAGTQAEHTTAQTGHSITVTDVAEAEHAIAATELTPRQKPPSAARAGNLQILFQRGASKQELVSMRNTSDSDYATVAWDCSSGGGAAIFHYVRKQSVTFDSFSFSANG